MCKQEKTEDSQYINLDHFLSYDIPKNYTILKQELTGDLFALPIGPDGNNFYYETVFSCCYKHFFILLKSIHFIYLFWQRLYAYNARMEKK